MFKKPREISSMEQLQSHLQNHGGNAEGVHWELHEIWDGDELMEEEDIDFRGRYLLAQGIDHTSPSIEFIERETSTATPITEEDVLRGAVQVIARRPIK
jgi:hypothetical protein